MRRITKKFLVFVFGLFFTGFFCEYLIYYIVIVQCSWPALKQFYGNEQLVKAFILADPHLLGPWKGHWFDKWRREWQMHQAFQAIITLHKPDVVFILGDLFDEGEWTNEKQFKDYVDRFYRLFSLPNDIQMHVVVGNHDIGFHNNIRRGSAQRFFKLLNSTSVQLLTLKDNHFVLINSMAMEGDSCSLCREARNAIEKISEILKCSQNSSQCQDVDWTINYSRPIVMQHFPLYRLSDAICTEPDAPPLSERNKIFRQKIDALSKEATEFIISRIKPRAVYGGHTHHGCVLHHSFENNRMNFIEYSVPSFSWRNRPDPKYLLVTITPDYYAVNKCGLPKETSIVMIAVVLVSIVVYITKRRRLIAR